MNKRPVTAAEIADLLTWARTLTDTADPADRAAYLAAKADLLARIADHYAQQWQSHHTDQARQIAQDAHAIAAQARQIAGLPAQPEGGAKSQEKPAPLNSHSGAKPEENYGAT